MLGLIIKIISATSDEGEFELLLYLRLPLMRARVSGGHLCEAEAPTEAAAKRLTEGEKEINYKTLTFL